MNAIKKVALISPKGSVFGKNSEMVEFLTETQSMESFRALWTSPNLGLITIAALFPPEWQVEYIDENYKAIDYKKRYDIVCVSAMTQQALNTYEITRKFRNTGVLTVIGGIHATIMPEEAIEHTDVVIAGEGEVIWPEFIADYLSGNNKKIYRSNENKIYQFNKGIMPRYELLVGNEYPIITIQTTRGCPHDCTFCCASRVFGSSYRRKSNVDILKELAAIKKMYPASLILFADDNFLVHRKESKELLTAMMNLEIRWLAQTDISIYNDGELLEMMVQSGCQWVVIGFESVHFDSLKQLDKHNWKLSQLDGYDSAIKKIQSFGIGVYGTFIVGLDGDDKDVFDITENFIKRNKLYGVNITVPTPLPGTRMREAMAKDGRILDNDWSHYTFWDVNIIPNKMSVNDLKQGLLKLYKNIFDEQQVNNRLKNIKALAKNRRKYKYE